MKEKLIVLAFAMLFLAGFGMAGNDDYSHKCEMAHKASKSESCVASK